MANATTSNTTTTTKTKNAPAPEPPPTVRDEEDERGIGYSLEEIAELSEDQLSAMRASLDGSRPAIGPNLAVMGFFKKAPDSQLIGIVRSVSTRESRFNPKDSQTVLFVEGITRYPKDVINPDTGEQIIQAGEYQGVFGLQLDAATMSLHTEDIKGARVHLSVKRRTTTPSGLKRYDYHFARVAYPKTK